MCKGLAVPVRVTGGSAPRGGRGLHDGTVPGAYPTADGRCAPRLYFCSSTASPLVVSRSALSSSLALGWDVHATNSCLSFCLCPRRRV